MTHLRDRTFALEWLRGQRGNPWFLTALRTVLLESGPVHYLGEDEMLEQIAWALQAGRLHVCKGVIAAKLERAGGGAAAPAPPANAGQQQSSLAAPAPRQKTWVEFAVVDMEGNPVSGKRFLVMLPDGTLQEGQLNRTGLVRFENIDSETSVFSLPDLDTEAWERVS